MRSYYEKDDRDMHSGNANYKWAKSKELIDGKINWNYETVEHELKRMKNIYKLTSYKSMILRTTLKVNSSCKISKVGLWKSSNGCCASKV